MYAIFLGFTLFLASCGQKDTIPPTTEATPPGGTYSSQILVNLIPNEPATVYYTTDGSTPTTTSNVLKKGAEIPIIKDTTLKWFAMDTTGNKEEMKTAVYKIGGSQ